MEATKGVRAVSDGIGRPNGICSSPNFYTLYITKTDQVRVSLIDHSRWPSMRFIPAA